MQERLRPDERGLLENARYNIQRLGLRIDDLLTGNQLEAHSLHIERTALDLRTVVMSALLTVHALLREKDQVLETHLPQPLPARGDPRRLEQVVTNLLGNAHRHTPRGTRIVVVGRVADADVILSIRDTGPGIPAGALEDIFQRFRRLKATDGMAGPAWA